MTTTAEHQYPDCWTTNDIRSFEIEQTLMERHPESLDLLRELVTVQGDRMIEAENNAIYRQGQTIMAAIRGDLRKDAHCALQCDVDIFDLDGVAR